MNTASQSGPDGGRVAVYAAWHIWSIAADAAARATKEKAKKPMEITADTVTAIIIAAAATEAFINELSHMILETHSSNEDLPPDAVDWRSIGQLLQELEDSHAQVKAKYLLASTLLPKEALRKGSQPYQDFATLINIRNDFVHPRAQGNPPKYFSPFAKKGWTYNAEDDHPKLAGWMLQLETPEIARWACRAARDVIWNIVERLDGRAEVQIQNLHMHLSFQWQESFQGNRVS